MIYSILSLGTRKTIYPIMLVIFIISENCIKAGLWYTYCSHSWLFILLQMHPHMYTCFLFCLLCFERDENRVAASEINILVSDICTALSERMYKFKSGSCNVMRQRTRDCWWPVSQEQTADRIPLQAYFSISMLALLLTLTLFSLDTQLQSD